MFACLNGDYVCFFQYACQVNFHNCINAFGFSNVVNAFTLQLPMCDFPMPFAGTKGLSHDEVVFSSGICVYSPAHQGSGSPLGTVSRTICSTCVQPQTGTEMWTTPKVGTKAVLYYYCFYFFCC